MEKMLSELWTAATALDQRLSILDIPRFKLPIESWVDYDRRFPNVVPDWYKRLLAEFAFIGTYLELPNYEETSWAALFVFRSPVDDLYDDEDDEELTPKGWFPFAEEADGNVWVIGNDSRPDSPVILLDHSAGGIDTDRGFIYGAHRLSHLLSLAAISNNGRHEHINQEGFVDPSRSGFRIWGEHDAYMHAEGIETKEELKERTRQRT